MAANETAITPHGKARETGDLLKRACQCMSNMLLVLCIKPEVGWPEGYDNLPGKVVSQCTHRR